jgi:hypothetical protein
MSDEDQPDDAMRALLKRSLAGDAPARPAKPVLREVQRKIRVRSKGKFFGDGWSTAGARVNYGLVAVVMLLIVAIAYFALGPMSVTR